MLAQNAFMGAQPGMRFNPNANLDSSQVRDIRDPVLARLWNIFGARASGINFAPLPGLGNMPMNAQPYNPNADYGPNARGLVYRMPLSNMDGNLPASDPMNLDLSGLAQNHPDIPDHVRQLLIQLLAGMNQGA